MKLTDLAPSVSGELLLPPGCILSLAGGREMHELWSKRWVARPDIIKVLSMSARGPVPCPWPRGVESFPALKMVRLDWDNMSEPLELAVFAHIPYLSLRCKWRLNVTVREGSWQLLELESHSGFKLSVPDMHSFLRSVRVFALTLPSASTDSVERLVEVCQALHVPLHEYQHQADDLSSVPMMERQTYAKLTILSNDKRFVEAFKLDSAVLMGVWPADPVPCQQSARWARVVRPEARACTGPRQP